MGYSVELMSLFMEMTERGLFKDIKRVADLGSQEMHFAERDSDSFPYKESIRNAITALGGPLISDDQLERLANRSPVSAFFSLVGIDYKALDADGWYGRPFDFNLDHVESPDRGSYCFTLNAGTTEHLIDQKNAFSIVHDLTRSGGLMYHGVPFLGGVNHGYFNYHPNYFLDLARFNSYEILGLWICPVGSAALIPWAPGGKILKYLKVEDNLMVDICCLFRKTNDLEFCIPFQRSYEAAQAPENLARYSYIVDGVRLSGTHAVEISQKHRSIETVSGDRLIRELIKRIRRKLFHP